MSEPTLYQWEDCKHGETKSHQIGPDPDCKSCKGEGYTIGVSGSDAYASDCHCVENCRGSQLVPVEPDYEAGAKEIGRLVYVQLADIGYRTASRRIVKAVLGIGGDDE